MTREQKFFNALRDVFVGARVEGESGYINLMRIKARYYEKGVFPKLKKDIDEALKPSPAFREELFDKLYAFFHRYFSESGSIYFRYTPLHQNVYEKVYTDDKDVMLFWKTHMLYYVKTDRLFRSLDVELDGTKFFFDVSTLEHKKANEKRDIVYAFKEKRKDGTLVFNEGDLIMDFFLGSATTTAVAHKLGRKWIGVEMGEHFYSVVLPRMKKVLVYDKSGISKEVKDYRGGFFRYCELEQYEDVLRRAKYDDADLFDDPNRDPYHQYVFLRDLKMLEALEVDTKKNTVKVDLSKLYDGIDIAETLSNLTGKWIKRISADSVEFEDGEVVDTKNLDWKRIKPLIWW